MANYFSDCGQGTVRIVATRVSQGLGERAQGVARSVSTADFRSGSWW
jgi:hypothetical protein